jgi:hypothetical protein
MIDQVDNRLSEWVGTVLDGMPVSFLAPGTKDPGRGVNLYLLELVSSPPLRNLVPPPWQLSLRYLVTTWAETPAEMHRALGQLAFAAMQEPELGLELEPLSGADWSAFGIPPRPSFILKVLVQVPRPETPPRPVLKPLHIEQVLLTTLRGRVVGPEDIPIVNALVEIPNFNLHTRTDADGNFQFAAIPAGRAFNTLTVRAKGYTQLFPLETEPVSTPIVLHFNPFENKADN